MLPIESAAGRTLFGLPRLRSEHKLEVALVDCGESVSETGNNIVMP